MMERRRLSCYDALRRLKTLLLEHVHDNCIIYCMKKTYPLDRRGMRAMAVCVNIRILFMIMWVKPGLHLQSNNLSVGPTPKRLNSESARAMCSACSSTDRCAG